MQTKLEPHHIFRESDARDIFGFGPTQLKEKIKAGIIPRPVMLAPPPSRARGWYGSTINAWREKVAAQQEEWTKAAKNYYVPTAPKKAKAKPKAINRLPARRAKA